MIYTKKWKINLINFSFSKKAISPVVATALLLVVAVIAVVGFQGWFTEFSSSVFVDVETQSSISNSEIGVESIVGNKLYFNAGENSTISKVVVAGKVCMNSSSEYLGINSIDVSSCLADVSSGSVEVLIFTNDGIIYEYVYLDKTSASFLNCGSLDGGDWVKVPGNSLYGLADFCVMKYEAKWNGGGSINNASNSYCGNSNDYNISTGCSTDGSIGVTSKPDTKPLTQVNQFEAVELCKTLGDNFHLITNNEWMTITRNIEQVSSNWANGVIGSTVSSGGGLKRGNVGIVDSVSYNGSEPETGTFRNTLALLNLTTGDGVWDFSGNVWEWTSDSLDCSGGYPCTNMPYDSSPASQWIEYTNIATYGEFVYNLLNPTNSTWNYNNGIGRIYTHNSSSYPTDGSWNTTHSFLRGGRWSNGAHAGAFALILNYGPSYSSTYFGFRCSYAP